MRLTKKFRIIGQLWSSLSCSISFFVLCSLATVETADEDASLWLSLVTWFNGDVSFGSDECWSGEIVVHVAVVTVDNVDGTILTTTVFPFWLWFAIWFFMLSIKLTICERGMKKLMGERREWEHIFRTFLIFNWIFLRFKLWSDNRSYSRKRMVDSGDSGEILKFIF